MLTSHKELFIIREAVWIVCTASCKIKLCFTF